MKIKQGPGWNDFWGGFQGFASHGMNAKEACCGCGGGNRDPETFQKNLPIYNGVPLYPNEQVYQCFYIGTFSPKKK